MGCGDDGIAILQQFSHQPQFAATPYLVEKNKVRVDFRHPLRKGLPTQLELGAILEIDMTPGEKIEYRRLAATAAAVKQHESNVCERGAFQLQEIIKRSWRRAGVGHPSRKSS